MTYALTGGDVGANGNINLNGTSTVVNGNVATPLTGIGNCSTPVNALTISGGASYAGTLIKLPEPLTFRTPPDPTPPPPTTTQSVSGNNNLCGTGLNIITGCAETGSHEVTFAPGLYGNVSINGNSLKLNAGTYTFNSVSLGGGAQLVIGSGPIVVKLAGQGLGGAQPKVWDMAGGTEITNPLSRPKDLIVVYGGTAQIVLKGGATTYAVVYAPTAPIDAASSNWYGALIGNTVTLSGGIQLHYDRTLTNDFYTVGSLRPISFSWSKY